MKYNKKLPSLLLTTAMVMSLFGCSQPQTNETSAPTPAPTAEPSAQTQERTVKDGTYSATTASFGWTGMMTCDVTFQDNAITEVKVVEEPDSYTGEICYTAFDNYIPRVIEAQSLSVDMISGATVTSAALRTCIANAIEQAGGKTSDWYTPIEKSSEVKKLEGYDVVVVGLGGSGILSFCAAAEAGAKVYGVETAAKVGGDSATTTGPMAINSEYLKNLYTEGKDYMDADALYNIWLDYVEGNKEDIVRKAVYDSGSALDWAVEKFGFSFEGGMLGSFAIPEWTKLWAVYTADETGRNVLGPNKTYQFERALDKAIEMSPESGYQLETTAEELIFDGDKVVGVKAVGYDGTTYEIYGKSVILATGGYLGNPEMMKEYLDGTVNSVGVLTNDGTGIKLGQSAGGALYNIGVPPMIHIIQVPNMIRNDDLTPDQKAILSAFALVGGHTMVTTEGKLWEGGEIPLAPQYKYYVVYPASEMDSYKQNGFTEEFAAATSHFMSQGGSFEVGKPISDLDDILSVGMDYKNVLHASSIADLASQIGCDAAALSETLDGQEGEYYAVVAAGYAYATVGGLDVDANMNVLREDGTPIENLFSAGQDCMGVTNIEGKVYTPWGGQAQSWTFVSGRIAGTSAAAYAGK